MDQLSGVFPATKKDGTVYYRSSVTFHNKHISLGSYSCVEDAHGSYKEALTLLYDFGITLPDYDNHFLLSHDKWVSLINFRDNSIYFKTPIYLMNHFFLYYLSAHEELKFDKEDLFYYAKHKISRRQGHLFISEYGMKVNILSRYGIRNYAVCGRDYQFVNGDCFDFRYENIKIINPYYGVEKKETGTKQYYTAKIHINGDFIVGHYPSETEAAIAYNKAADILHSKGVMKNFQMNYIDLLNEKEYAELYSSLHISKKITAYKAKTD